MKRIRKSILYLLLLAALLPVLSLRLFVKKTSQFSLEEISMKLPFNPEWEGRALSGEEEPETLKALAQSYRYLGSGGQNFAFVSEDGKYVIKFFKQSKFKLPFFPSQKKRLKMQNKRHAVFSAFKLSFDHLSQETGLLFIHLNGTSHLKKTLTLHDQHNHLHRFDLDPLPFVLQKKAVLSVDTLDTFLDKGDLSGAKWAIDQLLALPVILSQKGFRNRDCNFRSNYGFIDSQAIVFDVGRIVYSEEIKKQEVFKKEFLRMTPRFANYLSHRHPELLPYFEQSVAKIIQSDNNRNP